MEPDERLFQSPAWKHLADWKTLLKPHYQTARHILGVTPNPKLWFGDSVSLKNWKDIWLKEGFATYSSWLWISKNDPAEVKKIAEAEKSHYIDSGSPIAEPPKNDLYGQASYTGGALVLEALRLKVGDETFFKILKTYSERYRYGNAGTDEFIALAQEVSGQNLKSFFKDWLYSAKLPDTLP